ncbi:MAG TPA: chemotaxis protein CheW [Pyrinomonadaceae bacterium]|nr:chemotaxis protein CheW [Pyrinomonadaceae bacterium]
MIDEVREMADPLESEPTTQKLRLFRRGSLEFALSEHEVVAIDDWRPPTPLPHSPDSILGILGIQGRMLTVLDLARFSGGNADLDNPDNDGALKILALRGDEQLALVVDSVGDTIETQSEAVNGQTTELFSNFKHEDRELKVLNPKQLFPNAIQGRERRRRRF